MGNTLYYLAQLLSLGAFVCNIIVIVKMCQNNKVALGIISICCGLISLIVGWQNADAWGIRNVMMIYTILFVGSIALNIAATAMGANPFNLPAAA